MGGTAVDRISIVESVKRVMYRKLDGYSVSAVGASNVWVAAQAFKTEHKTKD